MELLRVKVFLVLWHYIIWFFISYIFHVTAVYNIPNDVKTLSASDYFHDIMGIKM